MDNHLGHPLSNTSKGCDILITTKKTTRGKIFQSSIYHVKPFLKNKGSGSCKRDMDEFKTKNAFRRFVLRKTANIYEKYFL